MHRVGFLLLLPIWAGLPTIGALAQECGVLSSGDLVINEILYDFVDSGLEFVEILNQTACPVELQNLSLSDARGQREPVRTTLGPLAPGEFAVIVSNPAIFEAHFPGAPYSTVSRWPALNNGGDAVVIAADGLVLDSVNYSGSWGSPGRSLERKNPAAPSNAASSWAPSTAGEGGSPGRLNSVFSVDETPPQVLYAEGESARVIYVRLSEPPMESAFTPELFYVDGHPPRTVEPAATSTEFRLVFDHDVHGAVLFHGPIADVTGNRSASGSIDIAGLLRRNDLVINEIMFDPLADPGDGVPDQPEYVEILNRSGRLKSLRGLRLGEHADENGNRRTMLVTDERVALPPNGLLVVHDGDDGFYRGSSSPPAFSGFGLDAGIDATWIALSSVTPSGLSNGGQAISLISVSGEVVDELAYLPAMHSLTLRELGITRGTSLERRTSDSADYSGTWTSSVARSGGTPGRSNSVTVDAPGSGDDNERPGLVFIPSPFSPDDDGHEDVVQVLYRLRNQVSIIRVRVFDLEGRVVRTMEPAFLTGSQGALLWDGFADGGRPLSTGVYLIQLEGMGAEAARVERHIGLVTLVGR